MTMRAKPLTRSDARPRPVPFTAVRFTDAFWAPMQEINRTRAIPANEKQCRATGRIDAFRLAWKPGMPNQPHIFWDSDVAKWIEAASCSLATHPDAALERRLDEVIALIASAQQADGYLNTHFTVVRPGERWKHFDDHELYCMGHLMEAGVAHHAATGKRALLEVCIRLADCIDRAFGPGEGQRRGYCGHEEVELALVKLARATGEERYLALARFMVDQRGTAPHYFDSLKAERPDAPVHKAHYNRDGYRHFQAHKPVREQTEVVGHAVRATYLYCAMADLAAADGDAALAKAGRTLWRHATRNLMYVTGGIGSSHANEGFTFDKDLPNESAYCETCASVGLILWAHRLWHQEQDAEFIDVLERSLYNACIAGMSRDGERFFYVNPLASLGSHHRQEWFGCSCCPPNISRLLASLGGYVYSAAAGRLDVHLYAGSEATVQVGGSAVAITQRTTYPWDGTVELAVAPATPTAFTLRLRRPGWCRAATVAVNGKAVRGRLAGGYLELARTWKAGDTVTLVLAMPVERIHADPRIRHDCGRVALQRGPIVHCLEGCDNGADLDAVSLADGAEPTWSFQRDLLGGVGVISAAGRRLRPFADQPYAAAPARSRAQKLIAIPYFAWDNRKPGAMAVWIRTP
jgi:hypothetical protein